LIVKKEENIQRIYRVTGTKEEFEGKVTTLLNGRYEWENVIGTKGTETTEFRAFAQLGFKLRKD
jgi:hypothetical protein